MSESNHLLICYSAPVFFIIFLCVFVSLNYLLAAIINPSSRFSDLTTAGSAARASSLKRTCASTWTHTKATTRSSSSASSATTAASAGPRSRCPLHRYAANSLADCRTHSALTVSSCLSVCPAGAHVQPRGQEAVQVRAVRLLQRLQERRPSPFSSPQERQVGSSLAPL